MVRTTDDPKLMRVELRMSEEFADAVDNWRGHQRPIPTRSEAIRRLVEEGIAAKRELELMAERLDIMRTIAISWAQDAGAADETVQMIATEDPRNLVDVNWQIAHNPQRRADATPTAD